MRIEGDLFRIPGRFAIIAARFNALVVDPLLAGALDGFRICGVSEENIDVIRVPGSFEIPLVAQTLGKSGKYVAVVCLGTIIRGDTDHYDHVAAAATSGVNQAALQSGVPVIFGILTTDTLEQALHRAGGKAGNKGEEAARTAVEMASLMGKLKS